MTLHVHLDPVGGISGDMFAAAMLDAFPNLEGLLATDLAAAGILDNVRVSHARDASQGVVARRFRVEHASDAPHPTHHYREIRAFLKSSSLDARVRDRAIAIFDLLADAEGEVHGVPRDEVHFHEIADWDSIADIVAAASLVERCGARSWSCGSVPAGHGTVRIAHGLLPLPAPATALLLRGFATHVDEHPGERTTPTGAAILRYLMSDNAARRPDGILAGVGTGCGSRRFEGLPNILRLLVVQTQDVEAHHPSQERVGVVAFEVDDMTPEELAVALERLRGCDGVLDASHQMRFGKKGRPQFAVQLLCDPNIVEAVARACFAETSTLGLRVSVESRLVLRRASERASAEGRSWRVKRAYRTDGSVTTKVESDEIASLPGLYQRRSVEAAVAAAGSAVTTAPDSGATTSRDSGSEPLEQAGSGTVPERAHPSDRSDG